MGILNTLKNTQKNYDPAKDKINDSDSLPSGDYDLNFSGEISLNDFVEDVDQLEDDVVGGIGLLNASRNENEYKEVKLNNLAYFLDGYYKDNKRLDSNYTGGKRLVSIDVDEGELSRFDIEDKLEQTGYVTLFNETDLKNSGVVVFKPPYTLTTEKTIFVRDGIDRFPKEKEVFNRMVDVPKTIKDNAEQFQALQTSLKYQVSCVIGGAGTGKSHVTAEIIRQFVLNDKKVAVLAPTHKAREALQSKIKVKVEVQTIHKFTHNPKECDVINIIMVNCLD